MSHWSLALPEHLLLFAAITDFVWVKSPVSHHPGMYQGACGVAEERLSEMEAQEGAPLSLLLE